MLRPWPEARLTPAAQPVALLMNLGPLESRACAALLAPSASGLEASELPHTPGLCFLGSITPKGYMPTETGHTTVVGLSEKDSIFRWSGLLGVPSFPNRKFSLNLLGQIPPIPALSCSEWHSSTLGQAQPPLAPIPETDEKPDPDFHILHL